jgi:VanZ family protein
VAVFRPLALGSYPRNTFLKPRINQSKARLPVPGFRTCFRIAFAIGFVVVVTLNLLPGQSLPTVEVSDKLEHFVAYALLGLIAGFAFPTPRAMALLIAVLSGLGVALELCQWFVPGRSMEVGDAIASGLGACVMLGLHILLRLRLTRTRKDLAASSSSLI